MNYNFIKILSTMLVGVAMLSSCSDDAATPSVTPEPQGIGMPVLFSADNEMVQGTTRAAKSVYMPNGVRFAADMYYQKTADSYVLTPYHAFLQVDGAAGNSKYHKDTFVGPAAGRTDNYGNDLDGSIFYWQNRNKHIFIGYIDNYNKAYESATAAEQTYKPDALTSNNTFEIIENKEVVREQKCKHFDLRNPKKADGTYLWTKMSDQYDPLIACTEKQPAGADAETNRVYLTFQHQFSQIIVNLKGHESVNIDAGQIDSVALLGISESADIFPFVDYDATLEPPSIVKYNFGTSYIRTAEPGKVNKDKPLATSFDMFEATSTAPTYLKTFEAIAYGKLMALKIVWHENEAGAAEQVKHVITFEIKDPDFNNLKSGKRYVYNLEIRRGTLAVIRTVIDDWEPYTIVYSGDGTIKN